jgi:nucleoside 2-deoxyribosyltransferase
MANDFPQRLSDDGGLCDIIIANLPAFRRLSADAGTLIEVLLTRGRPIFGYLNSAASSLRKVAGFVGMRNALELAGSITRAGDIR